MNMLRLKTNFLIDICDFYIYVCLYSFIIFLREIYLSIFTLRNPMLKIDSSRLEKFKFICAFSSFARISSSFNGSI